MPLAYLPRVEATVCHSVRPLVPDELGSSCRPAPACAVIGITRRAIRGDAARRDVALAAVDEAFPGLLI